MFRNLLTAFFASALLALLLSVVPTVKWQDSAQEVTVFRPEKPIVLSEQNLMDLFTLLQTHYNIKRVKWENQSIFVDFSVPSAAKAELAEIYRDFYEVAYEAFHYTQNTRHVYFRMLEENEAESGVKLLVAIEADRPQSVAQLIPPDQVKDMKTYIEETYPVQFDPFFAKSVSP
ncbi:hypothetical protein [Brevibacillus fulvus]|uniref:DNA-binding LytR/AlgR family response regulator n=1 Tax=Brevibacillus fulvus TaxID=1125967 RepID=A0A939BTQ7_9BACL|nr:hypothetical protein [Brevibacillus fulvus]MBM7588706.1 DNA-binding LytR/AlgR family response regulator [Brevibacillus fulvus]